MNREELELTKEERDFIRRLKAATKTIPPRLWLFCSESGLHVMWRGIEGERVFTEYDGIDQECRVDTVTEHCQSGAW